MPRTVPFEELESTDLDVDAIYEGGTAPNSGSDPISKLLSGVGNLGGFRPAGKGPDKSFVVLYTSGEEGDWPDRLDSSTGQFIYYGDNRKAGHKLHDTSKGGNVLLRYAFELAHGDDAQRAKVPPFFVFAKTPTARSSRSVQFKGLAVPGFPSLPMTEDLVAIWKATAGQRFQNYRAVFTILDAATISRAWIQSLIERVPRHDLAPPTWRKWTASGVYLPLAAEPTRIIRSETEQRPDTSLKAAMLDRIWSHFKDSPVSFESFAARIYQLSDRRVIIDEVTRASVDGGRDAIGRYVLGLDVDPVYAQFALEAKCYRPRSDGARANTVGVKEVARLISRLRHRQFGVLVTTSQIGRQAYEEVRGDEHPIVFICGADIVEILLRAGYHSIERVEQLLQEWPT